MTTPQPSKPAPWSLAYKYQAISNDDFDNHMDDLSSRQDHEAYGTYNPDNGVMPDHVIVPSPYEPYDDAAPIDPFDYDEDLLDEIKEERAAQAADAQVTETTKADADVAELAAAIDEQNRTHKEQFPTADRKELFAWLDKRRPELSDDFIKVFDDFLHSFACLDKTTITLLAQSPVRTSTGYTGTFIGIPNNEPLSEEPTPTIYIVHDNHTGIIHSYPARMINLKSELGSAEMIHEAIWGSPHQQQLISWYETYYTNIYYGFNPPTEPHKSLEIFAQDFCLTPPEKPPFF